MRKVMSWSLLDERFWGTFLHMWQNRFSHKHVFMSCTEALIISPLDFVCIHAFWTDCTAVRSFTPVARNSLGFLCCKHSWSSSLWTWQPESYSYYWFSNILQRWMWLYDRTYSFHHSCYRCIVLLCHFFSNVQYCFIALETYCFWVMDSFYCLVYGIIFS